MRRLHSLSIAQRGDENGPRGCRNVDQRIVFMFDESEIEKSLAELSFRQQLVFAASCCERLLPFYFAFSKAENWGNPAFMHDVLDRIWEIAHTGKFSSVEITTSLKICDSSTPDSEDFSSPYTSQAIDVGSVLYCTLEFCQTKNVSLITSVANSSYEAVEMYLQVANDPILEVHAADSQFDKWIETAPLLLAEINHQKEDIKLLLEKKVDYILIEKIRQRSSKCGVNPEKRGLL